MLRKPYLATVTHSNYSSIRTYNETGFTDYRHLQREYAEAYRTASKEAGRIMTENLQDQTARTGLSLAGWRLRKDDSAAQAVEWWNWDWESAQTPDTSSLVFGLAAENITFQQFGARNELVIDPRGYSAIVNGEAATFLYSEDGDPRMDPRVRLQTQVTDIEYSDKGVTIRNSDGSCVEAAYAICTFSLGVLQNDAVRFRPALPGWKQTAIHKYTMGTYTKIFMQFEEMFWPDDTQFFLYASPTTRGYFPVFQSLSMEGFLPGSNILFVTVVDSEAYRVERQSDAETEAEILDVLRQMFPDKHVPEPKAFFYPRWSEEPWAYGSYSNWPVGTTLEIHQNLRANVQRLWFAGEATSSAYFGFAHGAWQSGESTASGSVKPQNVWSLFQEHLISQWIECNDVVKAQVDRKTLQRFFEIAKKEKPRGTLPFEILLKGSPKLRAMLAILRDQVLIHGEKAIIWTILHQLAALNHDLLKPMVLAARSTNLTADGNTADDTEAEVIQQAAEDCL
ncbi:hypothetical protein CNMCM8980_003529 [Aspergillus fumigatiaffinis]|uniref:Amine oxidase domain-containing protein n=1 Tax=Aspergillus fumigatiaffinis TaxID=340414 RepID=A0A8H4MGX5_9EURO|nr:hypothetical protein CNMCM5878_006080 [Aspergillus fumigatiaffinis]KAF4239696.1 hypothetical protein CNMCM6457_008616 [Aspergillus fumigatiaffinis]KAF4245614.1 hypothetical protein CNMCM6805_003558 [Aspergillus fumigatiaffinis]KAF4251906.1 hypothetical protein CNMCM8980_003529 [Aspergillus fumigatiaffinis]